MTSGNIYDARDQSIIPVRQSYMSDYTIGCVEIIKSASGCSVPTAADIASGHNYGVVCQKLNIVRQSCLSVHITGCVTDDKSVPVLPVSAMDVLLATASNIYSVLQVLLTSFEFWRVRWKDLCQKVRYIVPNYMIMNFISVGL